MFGNERVDHVIAHNYTRVTHLVTSRPSRVPTSLQVLCILASKYIEERHALVQIGSRLVVSNEYVASLHDHVHIYKIFTT